MNKSFYDLIYLCNCATNGIKPDAEKVCKMNLENGAEYFQPDIQNILNDTFLGLSVVAVALVVWLVVTITKDPNGIFKLK